MTETIQLPAPLPMATTLTEALTNRRSRRDFSSKTLEPTVLATLLWSCAGITSDAGKRTVPSAKDCREIVVFLFDEKGVWLYEGKGATLTLVTAGDKRAETTMGQPFVATAPATLIFAADAALSEGLVASRGDLCKCVDTGCMIQAGQLAATALGLSSVARASLEKDRVSPLLDKGNRYTPIMALTVGYPL